VNWSRRSVKVEVYDVCTENFTRARVSDATFNRMVELLGMDHVIELRA
jgi:hypothetical protein